MYPNKLLPKIKEMYSSWKKGPDPFLKPLPGFPVQTKKRAFILNRDVKLVTIKLLYRGPGIETDKSATYAADLLTNSMGHLNSEFHESLVESGVAQSAAFWYFTQKMYGQIYFYLKVKPENIKKAIFILKQQIKKMQNLKKYIPQNIG